MGKMGAGKTLSMSMLATYLNSKTKLPIYANYGLKGAQRIHNTKELWEMKQGIFCFDEIWITMDSRNWGNNVELTHWVNQTRKKGLLVLYTTQHINQVEMRIRKGTDILIYCQRKKGKMSLQFIDYQYMQLGRRYFLKDPKKFYGLYDTFEVVDVLKKEKRGFQPDPNYYNR